MAFIRRSDAQSQATGGLPMDLGDLASRAEVLRAEAEQAAARIIAEASSERDRLLSDAAETGHHQGFTEGREKGYAEGVEQGKAEAIAEWTERLEALSSGWASALEGLEQQRHAALQAAEIGLLELGMAFARRVARRAVELDPAPVRSQLAAALDRAAAGSVLAVRVHPSDVETATAAMPDLMGSIDGSDAIGVTSDERLSPGSCSLDLAGGGELTLDVSDQLDRLVAALMSAGETGKDERGMESAA